LMKKRGWARVWAIFFTNSSGHSAWKEGAARNK
jgi:hypothetical protein